MLIATHYTKLEQLFKMLRNNRESRYLCELLLCKSKAKGGVGQCLILDCFFFFA